MCGYVGRALQAQDKVRHHQNDQVFFSAESFEKSQKKNFFENVRCYKA